MLSDTKMEINLPSNIKFMDW